MGERRKTIPPSTLRVLFSEEFWSQSIVKDAFLFAYFLFMNKIIEACRENLYEERVKADDTAEDVAELTENWKKYRHRIQVLLDSHHCPKGDEKPCTNCLYPLIRI